MNYDWDLQLHMIDFRCGLESYLVNKVVQANQQAQF